VTRNLRRDDLTLKSAVDFGIITRHAAAAIGDKTMKLDLRFCGFFALGLACLSLAATGDAVAQNYPNRPVHWIVAYPPGGSTDITARLFGQYLSEKIGQQFIIENRPGGGNNIGTEQALKAAPDGYTVYLVNPANAINATLYEKLNFNFIRDLAPIGGFIRVPNVMEIIPSLPAKTVPEFIAYAKANPGKVNLASSGAGTSVHMSGELFKMMTGTNMLHVPYRGSAPMITDLLGGQVQITFDNMPSSIEQIRAGKLRALAVTTLQRSEALPDVPVLADFVPGYEASAWFGMGAPRGTPPEIIEKLNREINIALADPKMKTKLAELGGMVMPGSPADFGKIIAEETEKWAKVVKFSGAKAE
jgi:tripartite-type tricarboxylate transporter receptor subunit TctC